MDQRVDLGGILNACTEHLVSSDTVESIGEVYLQKKVIKWHVIKVGVCGMDCCFCTHTCPIAELERSQQVLHCFMDGIASTFSNKPL